MTLKAPPFPPSEKRARTLTRYVWRDMGRRCNNPAKKDYKYYGARGVKICERWSSFENFLEDMGTAPPGLQLDRIDNDGDYCKENCRWATRSEQQQNTRRARAVLNGEVVLKRDIALKLGLTPSAICKRLSSGWSIERALTTGKMRSK